MKNSVILWMLTLVLVFASFVAGFYLGRNANHDTVLVSGLPSPSSSTAATAPSTVAPSTPPTSTAPTFPININTASAKELELLPGIGEKLAQAIVDYRTEYGSFSKAEDLLNVPGIGEKKLAGMIDLITTGG